MLNKRKLDRTTAVAVEEREGPTGAVAVAFVHEDQVEYSFFHSFLQMVGYDAEREGRVWRGGFLAMRGATGDLPGARNRAVVDFFDEGRAEWLLWIDTDMGFEPNAIDLLLEAADPVQRPVVGGMCFAQREDEADGSGGFRSIAYPVLMDWTVHDGRGGWQIRWDYPRNAVTQCHGIGSAFVLIHRSVFERVRDVYEQLQRDAGVRQDGDARWSGWYSRVTNPTTGELVGEDLSFCARLMQAEIPVYVHTGVQTTHRKNVWLQEQDYWRQRALAPAPEAVALIAAEERTHRRFAIIPTHNRPEQLAALVGSLAPQVDHFVILDNASVPPVDRGALEAASAGAPVEVIAEPEQPPHLSRYWNVMFDRCAELAKFAGLEVWDVGVFNDDAIVPSGWFDVCSTVLRGHESAVVAHTGSVPVHRHELVTTVDYARDRRMCPWAFVVRGELGLRADERLVWWYFDDQFNREAALAGGVLAAPGPLVINANAVTSTMGVLAEQAEKDRQTFLAMWAGTP